MEGPHDVTRASVDADLPHLMLEQDPKSSNSSPSPSQPRYSKRIDNSPQTAFQYENMQAGTEPQVGKLPLQGNHTAVRRKPVSHSSKNQRRQPSTDSSQDEGPYYDCGSEDSEPAARSQALISTAESNADRDFPGSLNPPEHNQSGTNPISTLRKGEVDPTFGPPSEDWPLPGPNRFSSKNHETPRHAQARCTPSSDTSSAAKTIQSNSSDMPENRLNDLSHQLSRMSVHEEFSNDRMLGKAGQNQAHHLVGPRQMPRHKAKADVGEDRHVGISEPSRRPVSQQGQPLPIDSDSNPATDEVLERSRTHTTDTTYHETHRPRKLSTVYTKAQHCNVG